MNTSIKPYNFILTKVTFLIKQLNLKLRKHTGRPLSISPENVLALGIFKQKQNIKTIKSVFEIFNPGCSYKTLVVLLKKFLFSITFILSVIMKENHKFAHVIKHTDSTDIPVCLNKNFKKHKVMKGLASWGYSGKGQYYGLRMNITTDLIGRLLAVRFTSANGDDRKTFTKMNENIHGIFVTDSGYISADMAKKFFIEHKRILFSKPRANMKKLATELQNKLYDTRVQIEKHFRILKEFYLLITSLPRSINGYLANYLFALLAYVSS